MAFENSLGTWDYVVIAFTMVVSIAIGFYFRFTGARQKTANEFLMAGRSMHQCPAIFSLVVTKLSAIAIIGEPSDVYMYGTQRCVAFVFIFVGSFVTAFLYLPVYFATGASTIYELLNMSVVIYTPAIAMNAVSGFDTQTSIFLTAGVCTVSSAMGGLKAVMWADVFQAMIMYLCLFTVLIKATYEAGGPAEVYKAAHDTERLNWFNFETDPTIPYTFWNSISYGVQFGISNAVNQMEVQRLLAVKNLRSAQSASLLTSIPSFIMAFLTTSLGLALYAVFKDCDPLSEDSSVGLTKTDQIVPYYIVSSLSTYPGLSGLCISGILCASISSLSSAINSLSTIFMEDFIKDLMARLKLSQMKLSAIAKTLVVFHGAVIVGLSFLTSLFQSVLQGVVVLDGMILGPTLGIFTLGILTQSTTEMGALIGLTSGALLSGWIGLGTSFFGSKYAGKLLSTDGCTTPPWNSTGNDCCNTTVINVYLNETDTSEYIFPLYRISYMWTYCIGAACTLVIGYIPSRILTFGKEPNNIDPELLSPVAKYWAKPLRRNINLPLENQNTSTLKDN